MKKPGAVDKCSGYKTSKGATANKKELAKSSAIKVSYDHYGQILNYNASHAEGSNLLSSFSPKDNMRRFLLGSVTAGALMFYGGRQAKAACTPAVSVVNCNGDLSAGVTYTTAGVYTTFNIGNLSPISAYGTD